MMTVWNRNACASLPRGDYCSERCCVEAANGEHEEACIYDECLIRKKCESSKVGHEGHLKKTLIKTLAYKRKTGASGLKPLSVVKSYY
jgi:hypothetical protein